MLASEGGRFETRLQRNGASVEGHGGSGSINFVPANLPLWGRVETPMRLRHLDLHFDPELCPSVSRNGWRRSLCPGRG